MNRFRYVRPGTAKTDRLEDRPRVKGRSRVSLQHHLVRIGLLMSAVAVLLIWLASRTEVMFADGLRYVAQAQEIDQGSWSEAMARAVDHPAYPLAIAVVHRLSGGKRSRRLAGRRTGGIDPCRGASGCPALPVCISNSTEPRQPGWRAC